VADLTPDLVTRVQYLTERITTAVAYLSLADPQGALRVLSETLLQEPSDSGNPKIQCRGLDTPGRVFFYEQDFYVLSNFSAFYVEFAGQLFPTAEHAYQWSKFPSDPLKQMAIGSAWSAHLAKKMADQWEKDRRQDWDIVRVPIMRDVLRCKAEQHEYVYRKLLATGERKLIENSWRDNFWGWGPNRDGQNMLGELWMEIRSEMRTHGKYSTIVTRS
jgi:ribA/ribD-fused uncharacterized protein